LSVPRRLTSTTPTPRRTAALGADATPPPRSVHADQLPFVRVRQISVPAVPRASRLSVEPFMTTAGPEATPLPNEVQSDQPDSFKMRCWTSPSPAVA
jgi:hypothetical protein